MTRSTLVDPKGRLFHTHLLRLAGEVVGRPDDTLLAGREVGVSAIVGLEDGELPAAGVGHGDVKLAVLAGVGGDQAGTSLRHEGPVQERQHRLVLRQLRVHRVGATSATSVRHAADLDRGRTGAARASSPG